MSRATVILIIFVSVFMFACSDSGSSGSEASEDNVFQGSGSGTTTSNSVTTNDFIITDGQTSARPVAEPQEVGADPSSGTGGINTITEFFGQDGNLYKPESDPEGSGGGNLVVLFSSKFTQQFDGCMIPKNDGTIGSLVCIDDQEWTQIPFSCFSNGNRQTWRASFKCSSVGDIRVTCFLGTTEYIFTVPDEVRGSVCSRFG